MIDAGAGAEATRDAWLANSAPGQIQPPVPIHLTLVAMLLLALGVGATLAGIPTFLAGLGTMGVAGGQSFWLGLFVIGFAFDGWAWPLVVVPLAIASIVGAWRLSRDASYRLAVGCLLAWAAVSILTTSGSTSWGSNVVIFLVAAGTVAYRWRFEASPCEAGPAAEPPMAPTA